MKVQVTKSQFIETDDIVFAEQDNNDPKATLVWLRSMRGASTKVYVDYDQFVDRLNQAHLRRNHQFVHTA